MRNWKIIHSLAKLLHGIRSPESIQASKEKWDRLSRENARYFIYSDIGKQISESDFRASGQHDFQRLVAEDQRLMQALQPTKGKTVVEIGCGTGRMTEFFAKHFHTVYGFDISKEMIEQGKERLAISGNTVLQNTDGKHIPLDDETVDFVFSFIVFQHMPTAEVVRQNFKEISRILKPGGIAKIQVRGVPTKKNKWFTGVSFTAENVGEIIGNLHVIHAEGAGQKYFWLWLKK